MVWIWKTCGSSTSGTTLPLCARNNWVVGEKNVPGRVISRCVDQEWPPRSCCLTPCDFVPWGFVISRAYANEPQTIPGLKAGGSTCHWRNRAAVMRKCGQFRQKSKSLPAESWGDICRILCCTVDRSVCVLCTEIKISALFFEYIVRFIAKLNLALLLVHPICVYGASFLWWTAQKTLEVVTKTTACNFQT